MFMKLEPFKPLEVVDLMYRRFEEICKEIVQDHEYSEAKQKINDAYDRIKEANPELYREIIIDMMDSAIGLAESRIEEYFYKQGLRDGLALQELLKR